jgi:hypothetical protein
MKATNLDKLLDKKLTKLSSTKHKRKPENRPREVRDIRNIRYCINLIKRGDFDPTYKAHRLLLNVAVSYGYVDKDTLEILQEVTDG